MKKFSQRTLPMQAGEQTFSCPVCDLVYYLKIETGQDWLFIHNEKSICAEAKDERTP